jgi:hypothetical protein
MTRRTQNRANTTREASHNQVIQNTSCQKRRAVNACRSYERPEHRPTPPRFACRSRFSNCFGQVFGGARHIPSARTKAQTVSSECLPHTSGFVCRHPTVRAAVSIGSNGAWNRSAWRPESGTWPISDDSRGQITIHDMGHVTAEIWCT